MQHAIHLVVGLVYGGVMLLFSLDNALGSGAHHDNLVSAWRGAAFDQPLFQLLRLLPR